MEHNMFYGIGSQRSQLRIVDKNFPVNNSFYTDIYGSSSLNNNDISMVLNYYVVSRSQSMNFNVQQENTF